MGIPTIVDWFFTHWPAVSGEIVEATWQTLSHRDRVLSLVGEVMDTLVGSDRYTLYRGCAGKRAVEMVEAFSAVGMEREAAALREINLAFPGGAPAWDDNERESQVDALPDEAWDSWMVIRDSFDEWVQLGDEWEPAGERVMLTRLYE